MRLKVLDLFSGIGGFSRGLEATGGFETVAFCEIEPFPQKVLKKHWPDVPIYNDVTELNSERLRADGIAVDVVCGGFPCQPFSTAAAGKNPKDTLSAHFTRIISECLPRFVIAENTEKKAYSPAFVRTLQECGYQLEFFNIGADEIGADHQRSRWWLCAYTDNKGQLSSGIHEQMAVMREVSIGVWSAANYARAIRVPYGLPDHMDRIKALGNSVVPQIPELIGRAILEREGYEST